MCSLGEAQVAQKKPFQVPRPRRMAWAERGDTQVHASDVHAGTTVSEPGHHHQTRSKGGMEFLPNFGGTGVHSTSVVAQLVSKRVAATGNAVTERFSEGPATMALLSQARVGRVRVCAQPLHTAQRDARHPKGLGCPAGATCEPRREQCQRKCQEVQSGPKFGICIKSGQPAENSTIPQFQPQGRHRRSMPTARHRPVLKIGTLALGNQREAMQTAGRGGTVPKDAKNLSREQQHSGRGEGTHKGGLTAALELLSCLESMDCTNLKDLAAVITNKESHNPEKLVAAHGMNRILGGASSLSELACWVDQLISNHLVSCVLELVSSGEPHTHIAVNLLHFFLFFETGLNAVLAKGGLVQMVHGILAAHKRCEHELVCSALSLLVSLAGTSKGLHVVVGVRGLAGLLGGFICSCSWEVRSYGIDLLEIFLSTPSGWSSLLPDSKLLEAMETLQRCPEGGAGCLWRARLTAQSRFLQYLKRRCTWLHEHTRAQDAVDNWNCKESS